MGDVPIGRPGASSPERLIHSWLAWILCSVLQIHKFCVSFVVDKVDRAVSSAIYFLLPAGEIARLHRIPCAETWHYYLGEPLTVCKLI